MTWLEITIDQLGKVVTGKTPPTGNSAMYDGQYPFVTPTDLDWQSYLVRATHSTVTDLARASHKNQFLPENSIAFTCIGNTIGKCGITSTVCLTNQQINSIVPYDNHDPKFIYYLMNFNRPRIRSVGLGGGAAQPIINKSTFSGLKVFVPETKNQEERISFVLSAYDDLIENNSRRIKLLEEAARLLYREWFVSFRFPGHEHVQIVDGVPVGWQRKCISELSDFLSRGIAPTYDDEAGGLVINQKCIRASKLSLSEARHQSKRVPDAKLVKPYDVLINSTGAGTLGRVAQNYLDVSNLTVDSHVTIARPRPDIPPCWYGLTLILKQDFIATLGRGATNQTELSKDDVGAIEVILPATDIVDDFENQARQMIRQITVLSTQSEELAKARDLLLPRLMDGRLEVA